MDNPSDSAIIRRLKSLPKPPSEEPRTGSKYALVIGSTQYTDPGLAQLTAPGRDTEDFARVLKDPRLCGFDDVKAIIDELSSSVIEAIDGFFDDKKPEDLLVLYFSGHGIRDEYGSLYLAFKNTMRSRLRSTAIKADYIREAMDQSRSKRQILVLDCCNSGAFPQGTKAEIGGSMGMVSAFQGYGRYVLTASDATQFAWEGDRVIGNTRNSLFTHFLVKGLEGEADRDGDGRITVDDLYDYAFEEISEVIPNQTPTKSASKQAGDITLRQITRMEDIKPRELPEDLAQAIADPRPFVREGAVQQLEVLLHGRNLGWVRSAREALEKMAAGDDSYRVRQAALRVIGPAVEAAPAAVEQAPQPAQPAPEPVMERAPVVMHETPEALPAQPQAEAREPMPEAGSSKAGLKIAPRQMMYAGIGIVVGLAGIFATASLLTRNNEAMQKPPGTLTAVVSSPQAASSGAGTEAPGTSLPNTGSTEAPGTGAEIAVVTHLMQPADVAPAAGSAVYDTDSSGTGPEGRAPYGDSYAVNRFERPFQQNMIYVPDLDILSFSLSQDADWYYVSIQLAGSNPNNALGIDYGVELDTNGDGYGDYIIAAGGPYTEQWTTGRVRVLKDSNHDTAAWMSGSGDSAHGDGYDTVIFDGGAENDDPDLAWVRMVSGSHAMVQLAFKKSAIGASFVWGVGADAGLRDAAKLDYRNWFTEAQAGSPVRASQYYPLGALYAVDNTCWVANGGVAGANQTKLCPASSEAGTKNGKGGGGSCNPRPSCGPAGYDPSTCLCN